MFYLAPSQSSAHNRRWRRFPASDGKRRRLAVLNNFFICVLFQPTITCSFSPHISHPFGFLTEQLVFGGPWSGQTKKTKHVSLILTCVINTRQLPDVIAHRVSCSGIFSNWPDKYTSIGYTWMRCRRVPFLFFAMVKQI
jgi:hypothetical protein